MEQVKEFLESLNLAVYTDIFETNGYDDLDFLVSMDPEECVEEIGKMIEKQGHVLKISRALKVKQLTKQSPPVLTHIVNHSVVEESAPDTIPDKLKSLLIPNEFCPQNKFFNDVLRSITSSVDYDEVRVSTLYEYIVSQRIVRWDIQQEFNVMEEKVKRMRDGGGKDGKLQAINKFLDTDVDLLKLDQINSMQRGVQELERIRKCMETNLAGLRSYRGLLYDKNLNFKNQWRVSELDFYVTMLKESEKLEKDVCEIKEVIAGKQRTLKARFHDHTTDMAATKKNDQRKKYNKKTSRRR